MILFKIISIILPWKLRRYILVKVMKYDIHPTARLGLAWVFPKYLYMAQNSKIDHFTVAIHLDRIWLGENTRIGRSNWITGFPTKTQSKHFAHQKDRKSELIVHEQSSITKNHHIDCTNTIEIGKFSTIAGYNTQLLTHSIDIHEGRQSSKPVYIGDFCFVGTSCVILGGAILPSYCTLGAMSLLNKAYTDEYKLYAGSPAVPIKSLSKDAKYFLRTVGFVY